MITDVKVKIICRRLEHLVAPIEAFRVCRLQHEQPGCRISQLVSVWGWDIQLPKCLLVSSWNGWRSQMVTMLSWILFSAPRYVYPLLDAGIHAVHWRLHGTRSLYFSGCLVKPCDLFVQICKFFYSTLEIESGENLNPPVMDAYVTLTNLISWCRLKGMHTKQFDVACSCRHAQPLYLQSPQRS